MSNGVACGQYKDKEEKNDQKTLNDPKNANFHFFLKNAFDFFLLLSQGTTIPKIRIPGQKMWAG